MHHISSTCYPKQAEAKNSQTKGLQNAFLLPELHFQSRAVVFSLLNLYLQPWNNHATFCSKILRFFWRVSSFTVKRDSTLPCADPFPELQEIAGFAQPKLTLAPQAEAHNTKYWCSSGRSSAELWGKEIKSQQLPSLSSGQLGHRKGHDSCHSSYQEVSHAATFSCSGATRQQCRMYLTNSVEDISSNNRKKSHLRFYSPRKASGVRHSTTMATYVISSASYTQDQQKPLMKPLVSVFFPCLSYAVLIGYFLKKVSGKFAKRLDTETLPLAGAKLLVFFFLF